MVICLYKDGKMGVGVYYDKDVPTAVSYAEDARKLAPDIWPLVIHGIKRELGV